MLGILYQIPNKRYNTHDNFHHDLFIIEMMKKNWKQDLPIRRKHLKSHVNLPRPSRDLNNDIANGTYRLACVPGYSCRYCRFSKRSLMKIPMPANHVYVGARSGFDFRRFPFRPKVCPVLFLRFSSMVWSNLLATLFLGYCRFQGLKFLGRLFRNGWVFSQTVLKKINITVISLRESFSVTGNILQFKLRRFLKIIFCLLQMFKNVLRNALKPRQFLRSDFSNAIFINLYKYLYVMNCHSITC